MPSPVISLAQMREWEKATWASGQTEAEVIRRVGSCVARCALELTQPGARLLLLAGKGHNGDDARSARPHLTHRECDLLEVTDPAADLPKLEQLLARRPALVIDGLFGIGINRPLAPDWCRFIERLHQANVRVLAVDVPSGLNGDTGEPQGTAVRAEVTLTVGAPKTGMLRESAWPYVGRLEVATDVGLVPCPVRTDLHWTLPEDFLYFPPRRGVATHKGTYGHAALVAGSPGYHGAAVLAARGAQRAQPGLITSYCLEAVYPVIASQLQAVMVTTWRPGAEFRPHTSALLFGPGLASSAVPEELKALARQLWCESPLPMVVDASALDWLPAGPIHSQAPRVITPHPGEAARLLNVSPREVQADRVGALRQLSARLGNTLVVLKGHQTLVGRSNGEIYFNPSGNPHLAQGGSGDVLSGYLVGLLAQPGLSADPLTTVRYTVWQHGAAADALQATRSGWIVEELIEQLSRVRPASAEG
jgi:ADP-dependent NAD(P)H-hydrate dehydratase / NAD(P)H-hydrate epimerase